jgi:hypothetical protein
VTAVDNLRKDIDPDILGKFASDGGTATSIFEDPRSARLQGGRWFEDAMEELAEWIATRSANDRGPAAMQRVQAPAALPGSIETLAV